jgi:thiol-disulfide isomerase/thioredoxin
VTHHARRFEADDIVPNPDASSNVREALLREVMVRPLEPQELGFPCVDKPKEIAWSTDLVGSIRKATDANKPLVLQFTADWCGYCKSFENFILPNEEVQKFADDAVFVRAKPEEDAAAMEAAKSLNINTYPTMVILDAVDGALRERGRIVGYQPLTQFVQDFTKGIRLPVPAQPTVTPSVPDAAPPIMNEPARTFV